VVDVAASSLSVEVTGTHEKIEAFLELAKPHGILEMVRTGVAGLNRGPETL
jgi:acetolactate synthase-1/3 small subunit